MLMIQDIVLLSLVIFKLEGESVIGQPPLPSRNFMGVYKHN